MKVHVHWMNLMKNQIIQKFQSFEFWKKVLQDKRIIFKTINGFNMSNFKCKSHVQIIILPKNMLGCPLKFILKFFETFV
jgi:hypothetical protein